jgi:hypothetical protein
MKKQKIRSGFKMAIGQSRVSKSQVLHALLIGVANLEPSTGETVPTTDILRVARPTLLEFSTDVQCAMAESMGLVVDHKLVKSRRELPKWSREIIERFRRTILNAGPETEAWAES